MSLALGQQSICPVSRLGLISDVPGFSPDLLSDMKQPAKPLSCVCVVDNTFSRRPRRGVIGSGTHSGQARNAVSCRLKPQALSTLCNNYHLRWAPW